MNQRQRRQRAEMLLTSLESLRHDWENTPLDVKPSAELITARRERFKLLEAEASVLRMLQGERRLGQQVMLGIFSFAGGSVVTLLVKHFFAG